MTIQYAYSSLSGGLMSRLKGGPILRVPPRGPSWSAHFIYWFEWNSLGWFDIQNGLLDGSLSVPSYKDIQNV